MTTRINARLDDELAEKVEEIRRRTGMTVTEIVEAALAAWTERVAKARPGPLQAFEAAGFIGAARGEKGLARNAKRELTRALASQA